LTHNSTNLNHKTFFNQAQTHRSLDNDSARTNNAHNTPLQKITESYQFVFSIVHNAFFPSTLTLTLKLRLRLSFTSIAQHQKRVKNQ